MKILKMGLLSLILLAGSANAEETNCVAPQQTVSFLNFVLNPRCSVTASYSFGISDYLFCYPSNALTNNPTISWTFGTTIQYNQLPISLVINTNFGEPQFLANANGTITITNNTNTAQPINCVLSQA